MFDTAINALLAGHVVCRVTSRDIYDYLSREQNLTEANAYLGRIGKRIASPSAGGAFFLVHTDPNGTARAELRDLHRRMLGEVRPVVEFMDLHLRSTHTDAVLRPGDVIDVNVIASAVSGNEQLRRDLADIAQAASVRGDGTDRGRLGAVIKKLESWGYIKSENTEREIYRATGMIDLFRDLQDFLIENTPGAKEAVEAAELQGDLL